MPARAGGGERLPDPPSPEAEPRPCPLVPNRCSPVHNTAQDPGPQALTPHPSPSAAQLTMEEDWELDFVSDHVEQFELTYIGLPLELTGKPHSPTPAAILPVRLGSGTGSVGGDVGDEGLGCVRGKGGGRSSAVRQGAG